MRVVLVSLLCASYLLANNIDSVLQDVTKLRQKYDECKKQNELSSSDVNGEILKLKNGIKARNLSIQTLENENTKIKKELSQKQGVISSLEKSLTSKDTQLRKALLDIEQYKKDNHNANVNKTERESLKKALLEAKNEKEKLEKSMGKNSKDIIAMENELKNTKSELLKLQQKLAATKPNTPIVNEKIVEKVVYKDNPKTPEYDKLIKSLQLELANAEATIANLKNAKINSSKEKIVYIDKPIEKIVEKPVEKIVYKEKVVDNKQTQEKIKNLESELIVAKSMIKKLQNNPKTVEKIIEKPIEKIVYVEKPKERVALKDTNRHNEKISDTTSKQNITSSKPSAYRMAKDAPIYNAPNGTVVDNWEARRSFTSGTSTAGWVKITGYFVNRVWQRADEELWVKKGDVIIRD